MDGSEVGHGCLALVTLALARSGVSVVYGHRAFVPPPPAEQVRVETLFSDHKSRGFRLNQGHLCDPERLSRLLTLAPRWRAAVAVEGAVTPPPRTDPGSGFSAPGSSGTLASAIQPSPLKEPLLVFVRPTIRGRSTPKRSIVRLEADPGQAFCVGRDGSATPGRVAGRRRRTVQDGDSSCSPHSSCKTHGVWRSAI